ncbi:MAG TPA: TIR domain-containing protein, partial [Steroidobacteraceae bacterium]|nr:TIR domain-containing protein [Steroidobacteraceae bacterium]
MGAGHHRLGSGPVGERLYGWRLQGRRYAALSREWRPPRSGVRSARRIFGYPARQGRRREDLPHDQFRVHGEGRSVTESSRAVFLSYASQDAQAAQRICEALRAAGIEVWFDQSELRGGDAWDHSIRRQIKSCALFIPIISKNTHDRDEGYFRLEWKLAVDRSHLMSANRAFLLPVVIDDSRDDDEQVPDSFRAVQWSRLRHGETPPAFIERVRRLLVPADPLLSAPHPEEARTLTAATQPSTVTASASWPKRGLPLIAAVVILGAVVYLGVDRPWISKPTVSPPAAAVNAAPAAAAAFTPPPHSIAVLPFVNLSGDKDQEYFSEGLTEEILNSLAEIEGLQVSGRTSAFSFQGKDTDLGTIARKLDVGAILEGSVRRSGRTVRITVQLINAFTGFEMWSKSYDRDLRDVLKLQTDIATAVAEALKVTLLGDVSTRIELGGTRNPAALDAYLRASKALQSLGDFSKSVPTALTEYTEAIRLDPNYALAFAGRSVALSGYAGELATGPAIREGYEKAEADAQRAIALAPQLAQAHMALADVFEEGPLEDFERANEEFERAVALAPGDAQVVRLSGIFAAEMGHFDAAIAATRRAVTLDPLADLSRADLGSVLYLARHYGEAAAAYAEVLSLNPDYTAGYAQRGFALLGLGDL